LTGFDRLGGGASSGRILQDEPHPPKQSNAHFRAGRGTADEISAADGQIDVRRSPALRQVLRLSEGMAKNIKVSLAKCSTYSAGLQDAVEQLLSDIGGIGSFVEAGQSVLIKPNLLIDRPPAEAVTTHPETARAVIRAVKKHGARPFVADSPASVMKLEQVWERTGFRAMCSEEEVPLVNLESAGSVQFNSNGCSFTIARPVLEADVIINIPKVKTHALTTLTAAVKNMYGAVPGFQKTQLHKLYPRPSDFSRLLAEIYKTVTPQLSIADGIIGMEGNGPSAGSPVHLGFLAASSDAVALDVTLCRMLNIQHETVPYLDLLTDPDGMGVEIVGADPDDLSKTALRVPDTFLPRFIPRLLIRMVAPFVWIRPAFTDKCIVCGRCEKACPVGALTIEQGRQPVLDGRQCIGCCCCHEVCPEKAISMTQSPLLNLVRRGKLP